jgi:Transglutaminase-like superfamily
MRKGLVKSVEKAGRLFLSAGRKFVSRPGEALLLCRMAWWVGVLSLIAKCCPLPRALQIVSERRRRKPNLPTYSGDRLAKSIDLLLSADFLIFKPVCWKRAAVLRRYLSLNGITTRIIFGLRKETDGNVSGHAWLESEGKPILEIMPPEYVVTYRFPSNDHFDSQLAALSHER